MSERSPHASTNGRAHILALGCQASLPADVRAQIAAEGDVEWVQDIYGAATQTRNRHHGYRALLLDLRALSRPQIDSAMALAARCGLAVWLLPMDAGRTRTDAAISAGAVPWPQVLEPTDRPQPATKRPESKSPSASQLASPTDMAARLTQVLLGGAMNNVFNGHLASPVPPAVPHTNGHERESSPSTELQGISQTTKPGEPLLAEAPSPPASPARFPGPKPDSTPIAIPPAVAAPATPFKDPLLEVAARFSQPMPVRSENVATPDTAKVQVTSTPPAEYDDISPVLSEDELRALLGPPE